MLGTDFAPTLRAAQAGEEDAFARLWRDANPAMVRYLRVVGHDPYDEACEGWMTVVRGLPAFHGDETDWRAWVLGCARQRAEDNNLRHSWGSTAGLTSFQVDGDGDLELDDVLEPDDAVDPARRGIGDTLSALRALPLGQGEVVVLRLGADLPTGVVAQVVGVEEDFVERAELRALERLGTGSELVSWSLTAPPTAAELADEKVALRAFQTVLSRARGEKVKIIAVGSGSVRKAARQVSSGVAGTSARGTSRTASSGTARTASSASSATARTGSSGSSGTARSASYGASRTASKTQGARRGSDARDSGRPRARGSVVAGRSRTAALAITASLVSVVSLGGLSAAAYVGVLPAPVQQAMHDAIGAPAPVTPDAGAPATGRKPVAKPTAGIAPTAGLNPTAASSAAAGLCRAWSTDRAKGTASDRSVAYRKLSTAAGGSAKVPAYCATALAQKPGRGAPTASVGSHPTAGTGNGKSNGKGNTPKATTPTTASTPTTATTRGKGTGQPAQPTTSTKSAKAVPTSQASTPHPHSPTSKVKKS